MKFRIIKLEQYETLYNLERETLFGWVRIMWGSLEQCKEGLNNYKKYGTVQPVVYEETI